MRFEDLVKYLKERYREDFLDTIAGGLLDVIEREIDREVELMIVKCIEEKFGRVRFAEDMPYIVSHTEEGRRCSEEVRRRVYK